MDGREPWDSGDNPPKPNWLEAIIIMLTVIFSELFFRSKRK